MKQLYGLDAIYRKGNARTFKLISSKLDFTSCQPKNQNFSKKFGPYLTSAEYGAIFIGMSEVDAARIETYNTVESLKQ